MASCCVIISCSTVAFKHSPAPSKKFPGGDRCPPGNRLSGDFAERSSSPQRRLTRDEIDRKYRRVADAEFREASLEAVVDDDLVLTGHGATVNEHEFARDTVLTRLLWIARWNVIIANVELRFDDDRRRTVGFFRPRGPRRRSHPQYHVEVLQDHIRIRIADCDTENLRIVRFEMVLWAITPSEAEAGHNLGLFDRLASFAAISGFLLKLFLRAQFAKKLVGEILQLLAKYQRVAYRSTPPAPRVIPQAHVRT